LSLRFTEPVASARTFLTDGGRVHCLARPLVEEDADELPLVPNEP
jgi:hypothetical protein